MLQGCSWAEVTVPCPCALQERAESITTFALCGFANLSSIGIMLGGLGECDRVLSTMRGDPEPRSGGFGWGRRNLPPQASCQHTEKKQGWHEAIAMILPCSHGQEHRHAPPAQVPPSHGVKSRDPGAESAKRSG